MICVLAAAIASGAGYFDLPEVIPQKVMQLLAAHEPVSQVLASIRTTAPLQPLSSQELADLARTRAACAVPPGLLQDKSRSAPKDQPAEYVLEAPSYLPYYYEYYDNYFPYIYTAPTFSFFFFNPSYYRVRFPDLFKDQPYVVPSFPYFSHPLWRLHPTYPYHSFDAHGYHPWYDTMPPRGGFSPQSDEPGNVDAHVVTPPQP